MDTSVITAKAREALRDLGLIFISAVAAAFIAAGAPWGVAIIAVLWKAGLVAVGAQVVIWITPLSKRYGVGSAGHLTEEHLEKLPV